MAPFHDAPARLPQKEKLKASLRPTSDLAILNRYLQTVARQPKGQENGLRILLQTCAELGNDKFVEALLCRGADANASNKTSIPPLHSAARAGHVGTIELLLFYHASIEAVDSAGRTALMHAALNGKIEALKKLLDAGANIGAIDKQGRTVVLHAASGGHVEALKILLQRGANPEHSDEAGRTAIMSSAANNDSAVLTLLLSYVAVPKSVDNEGRSILTYSITNEKAALDEKKRVLTLLLEARVDVKQPKHALQAMKAAALSGQNDILQLLIKHKVNVNVSDENGRSALLFLASDIAKDRKWNHETVSILLSADCDVFKVDHDRITGRKRTALQWSAATGHEELARSILSRMKPELRQAHVNKQSNRGKTALHLAAQHNNVRLIRLLLNYEAKIDCKSEGDWTPLLIAAKAGHLEAMEALLAATQPADINARTSSGMTGLHWACENGHIEVVKRILKEQKAWKNPKDTFDTTPLSRAGRRGYTEIIECLKDCLFSGPANEDAAYACDHFTASVVDFYLDRGGYDRNEVRRMPVRKVLYDRDPDPKRKGKFAITTRLDDIQKGAPNFRWIHLPANNLAWAEVLITKMITEEGPIDISGFQSMLRIFGQQQHRGSKIHSRFMRPLCQQHGYEHSVRQVWAPKLSLSMPDPPILTSRESTTTFEGSPTIERRRLTVPSMSPKPPPATPPHSPTPSPPPSRPDSTHQSEVKVAKKKSGREEIGVLFMPYLHWETDSNRKRMRDTVQDAMNGLKGKYRANLNKDACLVRGYLRHSTDLHLRRTLDQFRHHSIETDKRDRDQVVYRHHLSGHGSKIGAKKDPKIFMVDQMWIWIFSGIIITAFPERWGQPVRDPLNVFDGVIEDLNSNTHPPVKSVHDLAAAITNRCTGSFDRHEWGYEDLDFMFFEIFELSIGTLTRRATALLERFEVDSTAAMKWLKARDYSWQSIEPAPIQDLDPENEEDEWLRDPDEDSNNHTSLPSRNPLFVNRLLNISKETKLLVECKDIEDELAILTTVLEQQHRILKHMSTTLRIPKRRAGQQVSLVEQHLLDISRMQRQAQGVNSSLTQVLDLKQKHANAIEARFARDQAEDTARQGQTIILFTIVTIVFLPLSFLASFFAINIQSFPHDSSNGGQGLALGWVLQYILGIGFAVSVPLIALAFVFRDVRGWWWGVKDMFRRTRRGGRGAGGGKRRRKGQQDDDVVAVKLVEPKLVGAEMQQMDSEHRIFARRQTRVDTGLTADSV